LSLSLTLCFSGDELLPNPEDEEEEGEKEENYCDLEDTHGSPEGEVDSTTDEQLSNLRRLQIQQRARQRGGTTAAESSSDNITNRNRRDERWSMCHSLVFVACLTN